MIFHATKGVKAVPTNLENNFWTASFVKDRLTRIRETFQTSYQFTNYKLI